MQGLVYWLGLHDSYFGTYKLTEGAIVGELCKLLAAALPADFKVSPEYRIEKLTGSKRKGRGRRRAVDIAIEERRPRTPTDPHHCIEVKRLGGNFESDLDKLASARAANGGRWRAFVLVVAQGERPARLVTKKGLAPRKGSLTTSNGNSYKVRRVCKALHTLKSDSSSGYWSCLLELV